MPRKHVVDNARIEAGDVIVGLASFGQATYEKEYNGGMGSNGLTSARHDVLNKTYASRYPESYDGDIPEKLVYVGSKYLADPSGAGDIDVGKLILSPTRTYAPVIRKILENYRKEIHGIVHCSGGGQTKILHFINHLHIVKDNLFPTPTLFRLIREESQTPWNEMYRVFNMGHRMELYVPEAIAGKIIETAASFNIEARIIGRCDPSQQAMLTISGEHGSYTY